MSNPARIPLKQRRRTKKKQQAPQAIAHRSDESAPRATKPKRDKEEVAIFISFVIITFLWEITRALFWRYA